MVFRLLLVRVLVLIWIMIWSLCSTCTLLEQWPAQCGSVQDLKMIVNCLSFAMIVQ